MSPRISIDNPDVLVDEPVGFSVVGCAPDEPVSVSATWRVGGVAVRTEGRFVAPPSGVIAPARLPSQGGTYTGTEPYGLWWTNDFVDVPDEADILEPWTVSVRATAATWESTGALVRRKISPAVKHVVVRSGPLRGVAFLPEGDGPFPSVLVYSGSGGGLGELGGVKSSAALLASHGFATLALAYFRYEDLPTDLTDIPLEYFHQGIDWLRDFAAPPGGRVAVMGASRGGELSLLLGSTYPDDISAVVAKVPSGVVWGGFAHDNAGHRAAWTFEGRPVPWLKGRNADPEDLPRRDGAIELTPAFEAQLAAATPEALAEAAIPVERLGGPALLLSGEDDAMWASATLSEVAVERARSQGARYPLRHLHYPDAGHSFTVPAGLPVARATLHPVDGSYYAYGGSPVGNARANANAWWEIVDFLKASIGGNRPAE
jgi:dienelactone hydrolase